MRFDCDVLIVGAGPAGSALAQTLGRAGFDVILTDKKAFPRDKPCGEFLSPQCRPYLQQLGVDATLLQVGTRRVYGMSLHRGERQVHGVFQALPDAPHSTAGYAVRRELLDAVLVDAACARPEVRWLPRHDCQSLLRAADGTVEGAVLRAPDRSLRPVRSRWLVAADGVHSRVARQLDLQRPIPWLDRLALVAAFTGVEPRAAAEVHFVRGGYFAATTVDDGAFHLNLVVDRHCLAGRGGDLDAFVAEHLQSAPLLHQRLHEAQRRRPWRGIGPLAFRTTRQVVAGAALLGDACGYVDPLTGEGIYFALHGARSLATALTDGRADPARAALAMQRYQRQRQREVAPRLWLAALLQRGLRHDWIVDRVIATLAARPRWCDLLVTLTGDTLHPRELVRPSFWRSWRQRGCA